MNELGPSLPPLPQASKRRMTSQDWVSSRSLDNESEILPLPQGVSFRDIFNEDNPNTFASQSFTEVKGASIPAPLPLSIPPLLHLINHKQE